MGTNNIVNGKFLIKNLLLNYWGNDFPNTICIFSYMCNLHYIKLIVLFNITEFITRLSKTMGYNRLATITGYTITGSVMGYIYVETWFIMKKNGPLFLG